MGYYLMVKKAIGLGEHLPNKYLCKCMDDKDHLSYMGSGVLWRRILNKHKCEILTEVLGHYETNEDLREAGEYYSNLYNVVDDPTWANLIKEIGDGGSTTLGTVRAYNKETKEQRCFNNIASIPDGWVRGVLKWKKNPEGVEKSRQAHLGKKRSKETRLRMVEGNKNRDNHPYIECSFCGIKITVQNLERHIKAKHNDV